MSYLFDALFVATERDIRKKAAAFFPQETHSKPGPAFEFVKRYLESSIRTAA